MKPYIPTIVQCGSDSLLETQFGVFAILRPKEVHSDTFRTDDERVVILFLPSHPYLIVLYLILLYFFVRELSYTVEPYSDLPYPAFPYTVNPYTAAISAFQKSHTPFVPSDRSADEADGVPDSHVFPILSGQ